MTIPIETVDEICEFLRGTCVYDLAQGCEKFGVSEFDLTMDDLRYIDDTIFNCEVCGWWCEICEMEGEQVCSDCVEYGE